jgi:hypothetical protein
MVLTHRVGTFMTVLAGAFATASGPLRRELELWRWRRNFRFNVPAPIQDPRDPIRERSHGPLRVRLLSYAVGASPSRRTEAAPGLGAGRAGRNAPG